MSAALEAALRKLGLVDRSDPATMAVAKLIIELGAMTALILKSASASRPSGEWNDDDYDVLADGVVVGRIFKANASPVGASWMWTLAFGHRPLAHARLRGNARGRNGGIRQKLARRMKETKGK